MHTEECRLRHEDKACRLAPAHSPFQGTEALAVGRHGIGDGRRQRVGGVADAEGDELGVRVRCQILLHMPPVTTLQGVPTAQAGRQSLPSRQVAAQQSHPACADRASVYWAALGSAT
jgi:hypothetical protein